jgi:nitrogen regulatory protein P-II 2
MKTVPMKRVIIVVDATVEYRILDELHALGATGHTSYSVHGGGAKGVRPRHAESGNTKIEVIATAELADKILEHIANRYFKKTAIIVFTDDVEVLRGEKFGAKTL